MNNSIPYFESKDRMKKISQNIWMMRLVNCYSSFLKHAGVFTSGAEITSSGVVYIEGPYTPHGMGDIVEKSMPLINELVEIAGKIEVVQ